MTKKRLFKAALMAVALALSGLTAMAASSGKCGKYLTWTLDDEGALVVTGMGAMYDYDDEKNEKWDKTLIKSVQIGPTVASIGAYAFSSCESLTKVTLFDNALTTIGDFAFMWCINMKSITVSNSVKTIKQYAFMQCKALEDVIIGKSVSDIGMGVFSQCGALKSIKVNEGNTTYDSRDDCNAIIQTETSELVRGCQNTVIPNTVMSIGIGAFSDGYGLESIDIPNSVTSIKNSAFFKCKDLKHVTIGASVVSIGKYAFQECFSLRSVAMGASVASIDDAAFAHCRSLAKLSVDAAEPPICGKSVFSSVDQGSCALYVRLEYAEKYKAADTWKDFANIKTIDASGKCGDNLKWTLDSDGELIITGDGPMYSYFDEQTDRWDPNLVKKVWIDGQATTIGQRMFGACTELESVKLPNSLTHIDVNAFAGCSKLANVTIPNSVTQIGAFAFSGCSSFTSLTIPASVTNIEGSITNYCVALKKITVDPNNKTYDSRGDCNAIIETATNTLISGCVATSIPNTVTAIGRAAFEGCANLVKVDIPASVTSIGAGAFQACEKLTKVVMSPSLTHIDNHAFFDCINLESVNIPDKVVTIKFFAFYNCKELKEVTIGSSVESIEGEVFNHCDKLERIIVKATNPPVCGKNYAFNTVDKEICRLVVPRESADLYKTAFEWKDFVNVETLAGMGKCGDNLDWMLYDSGELVITGDGAMYDYVYEDKRAKWDKDLVKTVRIEGAVTNIGNHAFDKCSNMTDIKMPNTITKIGSIAFSSCYALTDMSLPNTVMTLGSWAYSHCRSLTKVYIPKSLTDIGNLALIGCENVTSMEVEQGNPVFDSRDNCNAIIRTATNTLVAGSQNTVIPNTVTSIGGSAFYDCKNLTNIVIPTSVTTIESAAFYRCYKLQDVEIPETVTSIGEAAFSFCHGFENVKIPNAVVTIDKGAFEYCNGVKTLVLGRSLTSIGDATFHNCWRLKEITVNATTPPTCGTQGAFEGVNKDVCILKVPQESEDLYKTAFEWKDFKNITTLGVEDAAMYTGINILVSGRTISVCGADDDACIEVYDMSGMMIYRGLDKSVVVPTDGIHIVCIGEMTFKVAVR